MDLAELRKEIDALDQELVHLFCQRMTVSAKIAEYKKEKGLQIYHPAREQEVLEKVSTQAGEELGNYIRELYSVMFALSKRYQHARND